MVSDASAQGLLRRYQHLWIRCSAAGAGCFLVGTLSEGSTLAWLGLGGLTLSGLYYLRWARLRRRIERGAIGEGELRELQAKSTRTRRASHWTAGASCLVSSGLYSYLADDVHPERYWLSVLFGLLGLLFMGRAAIMELRVEG
jgi:hypothetical protein